MRLFFLLAFVAFAWLTPAQVDACGATPPSFTLLTDDMGRVPAGTKVLKLYVYGSSIQPTPPKVTLSAFGGGLPVTIPVTLRVTAPWLVEVDLGSAGIEAGMNYSLTVAGVENGGGNVGYSANLPFEGKVASPRPSELGTLVLDKRASGKMTVGGCGQSEHGEHVLIKLVPSAAAEPWTRAVKHQLFVDGKASFEPEVPLVDYVARKMEPVIRAYARCAPVTGAAEIPFELGIELPLEAGGHSVKWTSTFPDGTTLETPAITVDLRCSGVASVPTPPCCKPLVGPQDALPADAGVNIPSRVDMGPTGNAQPTGPQSLPFDVDSGAVATAASAPDQAGSEEEGCNLGRGQRGGAQALALFVLLFLLHARAARRRA